VHRRAVAQLFGLIASVTLIGSSPGASPSSAVVSSALAAALAPAPADARLHRLLSTLSPNTRFLIAVEHDVDHDGDLDVIATTARSVVLWVNDGRDHFAPKESPTTSGMSTSPGLDDPLGHSSAQATVPTSVGKAAWLRIQTSTAPQDPAIHAWQSTRITALRLIVDTRFGRAPPLPSSLA
jgi:hypothetical protein